MAPPTNPNPADSSAKQSLEAGLAALKQQDYPTAIALLESVTQTAANEPSGIRAQMGLVAAYKATGNVKKAIALCSSLAKSPNPQVKTWADRALTELTPPRPPKPPANKPKSAETPPETGFVAFDAEPNRRKKRIGGDGLRPTSLRPTADKKTGFLPLEPAVEPENAKSQHISPPPPPPTPQIRPTSEGRAPEHSPLQKPHPIQKLAAKIVPLPQQISPESPAQILTNSLGAKQGAPKARAPSNR